MVWCLIGCEEESGGGKTPIGEDAIAGADAAAGDGADSAGAETGEDTTQGEVRGPYGLGLTPSTGDDLGLILLALVKPAVVAPGEPESSSVVLVQFNVDVDIAGTGFEDATYLDLEGGGVCRVVSFSGPSEWSYKSTAGDAGEVTVKGPGGEVTLPFDQDKNGYLFGGPPEGFFSFGASYTVSSPGGGKIGAFEATATAPADVAVDNPELGEPLAPGSVDRDKYLKLEWASDASAGYASLLLTSIEDAEAYIGAQLACEFPDIGHVMIPPEALSLLPPTPEPVGNSAFLVFQHGNRVPLVASGLKYGEFSVVVQVTGNVRLQ
jgi:hypothetical protein